MAEIEDKKLAQDIAGRDQSMALVRDNKGIIDCYARFFSDEIVRFLAGVTLCEYSFWDNTSIEVKRKEDGDGRSESSS